MRRQRTGSPGRLVCDVVTVRTIRVAGAVAAFLLLGPGAPAAAYAQAPACAPPGLAPPTACVTDGSSTTTVAPDAPPPADPGPALWIGVVFGVSGLAGIGFACARVDEGGTGDGE